MTMLSCTSKEQFVWDNIYFIGNNKMLFVMRHYIYLLVFLLFSENFISFTRYTLQEQKKKYLIILYDI